MTAPMVRTPVPITYTQSLEIVFDQLPPTSNKIYFRGTQLTSAAKKYAEDFAKCMTDTVGYMHRFNPDGIFKLTVHIFLPAALNKGFSGAKSGSKSRYKKVDLSNRIKLLEDCVRDFLAIDDSQTFEIVLKKFHAPEKPGIWVKVEELHNPKEFGLH